MENSSKLFRNIWEIQERKQLAIESRCGKEVDYAIQSQKGAEGIKKNWVKQ